MSPLPGERDTPLQGPQCAGCTPTAQQALVHKSADKPMPSASGAHGNALLWGQWDGALRPLRQERAQETALGEAFRGWHSSGPEDTLSTC